MLGDVDHQLWRQGWLVLGVDEAGLGPLAGPLYAACVVLYPHHFPAGLNDSKQLTEKRRDELYPRVRDQARAIGVAAVPATYFDEHGAAAAWQLAMAQAVQRCLCELWLQRAPTHRVMLLVDGLRPVPHDVPWLHMRCEPRLDATSMTVAAASIIAKVERDMVMRQLHQQYPQHGFARHKGYGVACIDAAARFGTIPGVHRKSFVAHALARRARRAASPPRQLELFTS